MDAISVLQEVEALYREILELTLRQEALLGGGDVSDLPAVVSEKFTLLAKAQALLGSIGSDVDRGAPAFQRGVEVLKEVLAEVVASEERCKAFVALPAPPAPPPARRVVAAYGRR